MSPRGKPATSRPPSLSRPGKRPQNDARTFGAANAATRRWRRNGRPESIRAVVSATKSLRWSRPLIEAVLDELYIDDHFEELLGTAPGDLRSGQYAASSGRRRNTSPQLAPGRSGVRFQTSQLPVSGT